MAEHKDNGMDIAQNQAAWGYFLGFWKYFFIMCFVIVLLLMVVGL